jgi:hypothetical protein
MLKFNGNIHFNEKCLNKRVVVFVCVSQKQYGGVIINGILKQEDGEVWRSFVCVKTASICRVYSKSWSSKTRGILWLAKYYLLMVTLLQKTSSLT